VETRWLFELTSDVRPHQSALTRHQADLVERCDRFIRSFPGSRYAPSALFIKARALDMRVDPGEFRRTKWIRFYDDFPSPTSRQAWQVIVENRPGTAPGAVALLRLAQIEAREGDVERAIDKLKMLCERFGLPANGDDASEPHAGLLKGVLAREVPEAGLHIPIERILLEADRLYDLLSANRDPLYGYDPIAGSRHRADAFSFGLLDLDPRHDNYIENLKMLRAEYPKCQLEDNIDLEIAKATASQALQVQRLEACLRQFPDRDQVPEALFRLGVALAAADRSEESERVLARLLRNHPSSIWATQAAKRAPWQAVNLNARAVSPGLSETPWGER
jgi:outer membrane protein assembly factor BamD (BamD/ComL family)